jgi:hypothetical protein
MKIILTSQNEYLNFKNEEKICTIQIIHATCSTVTRLIFYTQLLNDKWTTSTERPIIN